MKTPAQGHRICLAMTVIAMLIGSAHAEDVAPDELGNLVKGRKWMISPHGNFSETSPYWDFHADGSMCVRLPGSKPDAPCADAGQWRIDGQALCWDLKWYGESYGFKSACMRIRKVGEQQFEAFNITGGYRQFVFRPVK